MTPSAHLSRGAGTARRLAVALALLAALALPLSASAHRSSGPRFDVVAAENFWGSIAAQLAGNRAAVQSIIVNPDTDPHSYEPTASDARTMAGSQLAIVNGIGYDNWASQLLAADPSGSRVVVDVGDVLGLKDGDNPHQWYSPTSVHKVIDAIVAAYDKLDPTDASYFAARKHLFVTKSLARYNALRAEIRKRFAGVPVGYSESIFQPLGASLGLKLLTPYSFAKAIAEGTEVSAKDKQTVDRQAQKRLIAVWVFNSQNVTPEVQEVNAIAKARHIPIATVTETLSPATLSFEQWQVAELEGLIKALHQATGR
jgi:zinc/manganese transport system substrate-binding protein